MGRIMAIDYGQKRAGIAGDRPLLQGRRVKDIADLLQRRESYYAFADLCIDTDGKDAVAVAGEIEEALKTWLASLS
ncbi:MAG: shikimate kinase [Bacteroidales bacterium]|nr:shikimate kinase [Bacteroidales bacterium]